MERARLAFFADWLKALEDLARDNASAGQGGVVDVAANAKLGRILGRLGSSRMNRTTIALRNLDPAAAAGRS